MFGTSNQLLAALTLLAVSVWLHRRGRRCWSTVVPMLFVMISTVWSLLLRMGAVLGRLLQGGQHAGLEAVHGVVAAVLVLLAGVLTVEGGRRLVQPVGTPSRP